jgi:hypothetical protein
MPRILVTAERSGQPPDPPVLLDEKVLADHLSDGSAAAQLIERIGWAVSDAEEVERDHDGRRRSAARRSRTPLPCR